MGALLRDGAAHAGTPNAATKKKCPRKWPLAFGFGLFAYGMQVWQVLRICCALPAPAAGAAAAGADGPRLNGWCSSAIWALLADRPGTPGGNFYGVCNTSVS
jgi:hypothetical protein